MKKPIPAAVREYLRSLASKAGSAGTGKAKARTTAQARAAVMAYWNSPAGKARRRKAKK